VGNGLGVPFPVDWGILGDTMAMTKGRTDDSRGRRLPGLPFSGWSLVLITALAAGCAHSERKNKEEPPASVSGIPAPKVPTFLNGAMAVLLTNANGFRAHVVLEGPPSPTRTDIFSGELMSRDGKLFFAPEPGASPEKHSRAEDFSYIWNVEENRGFLLSGPLQGYAPISSSAPITNVIVVAGGNPSAPERVGGYSCLRSEVKVIFGDGTETALGVWRARDLKAVPVRIARNVAGTPLTLTLSKIRLEPPPTDVVAPPPDFTRYTSAETMMNEQMTRQQNVKRKRGWQPPPSEEIGIPNPTTPGVMR
jgi:hypothetical protein